MNTAIVVGAGATLAEALTKRPSRAQTPPLDATFFQLCDHAGLAGRDTVKRYMTSTYGLDSSTGEFTMEQIFNYIHADASSGNPSDACLSAYWALMRMYAEAIRSTTNDLDGSSRDGIGALLRFLLSSDPNETVAFITFNQDLVIERSIETTSAMAKYSAMPWNLARCYSTEFSQFIRHADRARFKTVTTAPRPRSTAVLKLHGSLNWVYTARSATDRRNCIRNPGTRPILYFNQQMPASMSYRENQRKLPLLPLIVPPIFEKTPRYRQQLSPVWAAAEQFLTDTERLIVFGYSFPDGDLAARALFRRCFHRNTRLSEIHVIDPDPIAGARIAQLTDASRTHIYRSLSAFRESIEMLASLP